jgi:hypothetical protein
MAKTYHDNSKLRQRIQTTLKKEAGLDIEIAKIVDADDNLEFSPSKGDISHSDRKTHTNCMLARCANRIGAKSGVVATVVGTSTAFLILKDDNDEFVAARHIVPAATQREIVAYDRGGKPPKGATMLLKAPSKAVRLDNYIPQKVVNEMTPKAKARAAKAGKTLGYTGGWRKNRTTKGTKRPLRAQHKAFKNIQSVRRSLLAS